MQGRAKLRGVIRGIALAALLVAFNGFAAFNWIPSSYEQFSWEAYAGVVYTATSTATATGTATATATATSTGTPGPDGASCMVNSQCTSEFCVEGTCCNTICNLPNQTCVTGTCAIEAAAAPAASHRTLLLIIVLLVAIGCFALAPLRSGKRQ